MNDCINIHDNIDYSYGGPQADDDSVTNQLRPEDLDTDDEPQLSQSIDAPPEDLMPQDNNRWGLQLITGANNLLTIFYQNIRRHPGDPYTSLVGIQQEFNPDILCLCEMSLNYTKPRVLQLNKDYKLYLATRPYHLVIRKMNSYAPN